MQTVPDSLQSLGFCAFLCSVEGFCRFPPLLIASAAAVMCFGHIVKLPLWKINHVSFIASRMKNKMFVIDIQSNLDKWEADKHAQSSRLLDNPVKRCKFCLSKSQIAPEKKNTKQKASRLEACSCVRLSR
jgi:hypothetical protein